MSFFNVAMISVAEIVGDFSLEKFADTNEISALTVGIIGYIAVIYFLIKGLKQANILQVNLLWDGLSALIESLAAILILRQSFKNGRQWIGASLIIAGLFLIKFVPEGTIKQASSQI